MLLLRRARTARTARACRRGLCATSRGPLLPQWGSFGKTQEQVLTLEAQIREDGQKQLQLQIQMAEMAQRAMAMVTQPFQYFGDAEWRKEWIESSREPRERYAQIHDRLLDGCEAAYEAIVDEFTSEEPDFDLYVKSGALDPELARFLSDAAAKYRNCGQRPAIDVARVSAQVLLFSSSGTHFTATVAIKSREAHSCVSTQEPRPAAATAAAPTEEVTGSVGNDVANEAVAAAADAGEGGAGGEDEAAGETGHREVVQLWTFSAPTPKFSAYLQVWPPLPPRPLPLLGNTAGTTAAVRSRHPHGGAQPQRWPPCPTKRHGPPPSLGRPGPCSLLPHHTLMPPAAAACTVDAGEYAPHDAPAHCSLRPMMHSGCRRICAPLKARARTSPTP